MEIKAIDNTHYLNIEKIGREGVKIEISNTTTRLIKLIVDIEDFKKAVKEVK